MRIFTLPLRPRTLDLASMSTYVMHINALRRPFQPARANGAQSRRVSSPTYPHEKDECSLIEFFSILIPNLQYKRWLGNRIPFLRLAYLPRSSPTAFFLFRSFLITIRAHLHRPILNPAVVSVVPSFPPPRLICLVLPRRSLRTFWTLPCHLCQPFFVFICLSCFVSL